MSDAQTDRPEDRWRRTVDQRGRALKLKVGRLIKDFGHARLDAEVGEVIEARLRNVGLSVQPSLRDATAGQVITLVVSGPAANGESTVDEAQRLSAPPERPAPAVRNVAPAPAQPAPEPPPRAPAEGSRGHGDDAFGGPAVVEQSELVRAAVEAERRVRNSYERAATASADRISGLERELQAERDATTRARDERDTLERRLHVERRDTAARIQALASAERTARGLLEAQRTELSNLTQTARVSSTTIAETRETLDDIHGQVQQTATEIREALTESVLADTSEQPAQPDPGGACASSEENVKGRMVLFAPSEDVAATASEAEPDPAPASGPAWSEPTDAWPQPEPSGEHDHEAFAEQPDPADDAQLEPADVLATGPDEPEPEHNADDWLAEPSPGDDWPAQPEPEPDRRPLAPSGVKRAAEAAEAERQPSGKRPMLGRRRRSAPTCVVCGQTARTRDAQKLGSAGWSVEGDAAICKECVADHWKLKEGSDVPYRARD
ncbi:MAG: hypothetical protein WKF48_02085 [Solirubrobacteraceae bacterium]